MPTDLKNLLRNLYYPFNGIDPHSVVVMDNCSIHHVERIVELIATTGALVIFLPPYSPDFNAIEEAFAKVKAYLKANEMAVQATDDITEMVLMVFATITQEDCLGWIEHSGYLYIVIRTYVRTSLYKVSYIALANMTS